MGVVFTKVFAAAVLAVTVSGCSETLECGSSRLVREITSEIDKGEILLTTETLAGSPELERIVSSSPDAVIIRDSISDYLNIIVSIHAGNGAPPDIDKTAIFALYDPAFIKKIIASGAVSALTVEAIAGRGYGNIFLNNYCSASSSRCNNSGRSALDIVGKSANIGAVLKEINNLTHAYTISDVITTAVDPGTKRLACSANVTLTYLRKYATTKPITYQAQLDATNKWHLEISGVE